MKISDLFASSNVRLTNLTFENNFPAVAVVETEVSANDYLGDYCLSEKVFEATFKRTLSTMDKNLQLQVIFKIVSTFLDGVDENKDEIIKAVESNKNEFLGFSISEASIVISNVMRSSGFPPVITQPAFIEQ